MKRRDFLVGSAGLAGYAIPLLARAASSPCPPPSVTVNNGSPVATTCSQTSAAADWLARSTGPGVVWAHNFASAAEVDHFRWRPNTGNDLTNLDGIVNYITTDGFAGGGAVELSIATNGNSDGRVWWRPMAALTSPGNGLSTDDPAANGTVTRHVWSPQQNVDAGWSWLTGYYGNPSVQAAHPTWSGNSGIWDGSDFYFQVRVKISASRWAGGYWDPYGSLSGATQGANPQGKLLYLDVMGLTGTQENLVRSNARLAAYGGTTGTFDIYTSEGNYLQSYLGDPQGNTGSGVVGQPGGPNGSACKLATGPNVAGSGGTCWEWPTDTWVTLLFHITPGSDNSNIAGLDFGDTSTWHLGHQDHGIEVWAAYPGDANNGTAYTKIWSKLDYLWQYNTGGHHPPAFNGLSMSIYMNGATAYQGWTQRYTQMIFSKNFIPCPQA